MMNLNQILTDSSLGYVLLFFFSGYPPNRSN